MTPTDYATNVITQMREWAKQPYRENMNLGGWFLFICAVGVMTLGWKIIQHDFFHGD